MPHKAPDDRRAVELVIVPDLVGEHFVSAPDKAETAGLTLVNLHQVPATLFTEGAG